MRTLKLGDRGKEVLDVQSRLSGLGYDVGTDGVDGLFGPDTQAAVLCFQQKIGLLVDGIVAENTWQELVEARYEPGERLLYLRIPPFRGADVLTLQRSLNRLGFNAGPEDAIFGAETEIKLRRLDTCPNCKGTGSSSGRGPATCSQCHGRGQIRYQQGFFSVARTCAACRGTGSVISDPCTTCRGEGRASAEFKLKVKIPPGVEEGTRIRYAGEGDVGRAGGPKGDLYIVLSVRPHDFFERQGYDLYCVIPISFPQAALGAEIDIPGIDGPIALKIPEGTQSGKELRVRGRGVPHLNDKGKGDLVVKVIVEIPKKLTRAQRDLIAQLAESMTVDNKPASPSLLEKMKELFS